MRFALLRPSTGRDALGPRGERVAARHLKRKGYKVLARNAVLKVGEADIVCLAPDRRTIVIVEVKARRTSPDGEIRYPEDQVGRAKRGKLRQIAAALAKANGWLDRPLRIDVVAVEFPAKGAPVIRHIESAVGAAE